MAFLASGRADLAGSLAAKKLIPRVTRQTDGSLGSPVRDRAILLEATVMGPLKLETVVPDPPACKAPLLRVPLPLMVMASPL